MKQQGKEDKMYRIINSSFNKINNRASFTLAFKKTKLSNILNALEMKKAMMIVERLCVDENLFSNQCLTHSESHTTPLVYEIGKDDYETIEKLVILDEEAEIIIIDTQDDSFKESIIQGTNNNDKIIANYQGTYKLVSVNRFENEIFVLLSNVSFEQYDSLKNLFKLP